MTEPSQYFKGRTVQEQMNEVIGYVDVRSAEVATTAIAADVAQVHQDMLDADADAQAAAASAAAAAGTLANAVKKTGESSQSIAGNIAVAGTLSGSVVTGTTVTVPTPVNNTDAANKKYVNDQDALLVPIANINQYAVGLTSNQGPIAGVKEFTSKIVTPVAGYVWGGYPDAASYRKMASVNAANCYVNVKIMDTSGKFAEFIIFFGSGVTPMVAVASSNAAASGYRLAATYDSVNSTYDIYFKTTSTRNHVAVFECVNRYRDGITMTLYADSGDFDVTTVPGQSAEAVVS